MSYRARLFELNMEKNISQDTMLKLTSSMADQSEEEKENTAKALVSIIDACESEEQMLEQALRQGLIDRFDYDRFEDDVFDSRNWSASVFRTKSELINGLNQLSIVGRTISDIRFVSHVYNMTRNWISESAIYSLGRQGASDDEIRDLAEYENIPDDLSIPHRAEIDEPLIITFEDGNQLEILASSAKWIRVGMNHIARNVKEGINAKNVDANRFFACCLNRKIANVEVFQKDGEYEQISLVLWLDNEIGMEIEADIDYCEVYLIDKNREIRPIHFEEVKDAVFNWEDLHADESLGFWAKSSTIFFGEKGLERAPQAYITVTNRDRSHCFAMGEEDYEVLAWAMSEVLGFQHDIYDDYEFSYTDWERVLDIADKITSFRTFDELFDYVLALKDRTNGRCDLIYYVNNVGPWYWNNRMKHAHEADDIRRWSKLVFKQDETVFVCGY